MDNGETMVAVLGVICAVGLPVVMAILICFWVLTGKHKERMAMIERGIVPEEVQRQKANPNRYIALRNGILMISLALGALVGFILDAYITNISNYVVLPATTILFGGIGFVVYFFLSHYLERKEAKENLPQAMND
ncbi:MAG: DUF6249 domain-containing protein [Parabacteroides sp.]